MSCRGSVECCCVDKGRGPTGHVRMNVLSPRSTPVLIMFGARGVTTTPARGLFQCPSCGVSRAYTLRRVRRFFVFFFVPIVPLRGEKTFVQCGFCRRAFRTSVLEAAAADRVTGSAAEPPISEDDPIFAGAAASTLLTWQEEESGAS